jgi:hypothetical protein
VSLVLLGRQYDLNKSDWASWIQGVGSIAAILGSFALARHEAKTSDEARRLDNMWREYEFTQTAVELATDVERSLVDIVTKMNDRQVVGRTIGPERLLQVQRALDTFSQKDLSPLVLRRMLILQREVAYSLTAVREVGRMPVSEPRLQNAVTRLEAISACRDQILEQARYYARVLNDHFD